MVIVVFVILGNCRTGRLNAGGEADQQDQQAHDGGKHRPANEDIGEHGLPLGFTVSAATRAARAAGCCRSGSTPLGFSLSWPVVTTCSPAANPKMMATRSSRTWPVRTKRRSATRLPAGCAPAAGCSAALRGRRRLHHVDAVAIKTVGHRSSGNGDGIPSLAHKDGYICKHAGQELVLLVGQDGAYQKGSRILRYSRVERLDLALEGLARESIDGQLNRLSDLQLANLLLGYREIGTDWIESLQRDERHARRYVLALLHLADADSPTERSGYGLLRDDGLYSLHGGLRRLLLGARRVEIGFRRYLLGHQVGLACVGDFGFAMGGDGAGEVGDFDRRVELYELRAVVDLGPAVDQHVCDNAGHLARDVHALGCDQGADGGNALDPFFGLGSLGRHRRRWRLHLRQEGADHLRLEDELEVAEAAQKTRNYNAGNDNTSDHCASPRPARDTSSPPAPQGRAAGLTGLDVTRAAPAD